MYEAQALATDLFLYSAPFAARLVSNISCKIANYTKERILDDAVKRHQPAILAFQRYEPITLQDHSVETAQSLRKLRAAFETSDERIRNTKAVESPQPPKAFTWAGPAPEKLKAGIQATLDIFNWGFINQLTHAMGRTALRKGQKKVTSYILKQLREERAEVLKKAKDAAKLSTYPPQFMHWTRTFHLMCLLKIQRMCWPAKPLSHPLT